jgi:hypothetical protein
VKTPWFLVALIAGLFGILAWTTLRDGNGGTLDRTVPIRITEDDGLGASRGGGIIAISRRTIGNIEDITEGIKAGMVAAGKAVEASDVARRKPSTPAAAVVPEPVKKEEAKPVPVVKVETPSIKVEVPKVLKVEPAETPTVAPQQLAPPTPVPETPKAVQPAVGVWVSQSDGSQRQTDAAGNTWQYTAEGGVSLVLPGEPGASGCPGGNCPTSTSDPYYRRGVFRR